MRTSGFLTAAVLLCCVQDSEGAAPAWAGGGLSWLAVGGLLGGCLAAYAYMQLEAARARAARLASMESSVGVAQVPQPRMSTTCTTVCHVPEFSSLPLRLSSDA